MCVCFDMDTGLSVCLFACCVDFAQGLLFVLRNGYEEEREQSKGG